MRRLAERVGGNLGDRALRLVDTVFVDLLPIAKDSYWGPGQVTSLALVYVWTGERDRALDQLEIVAKIPAGPAGPTYGDLKFNPCWDSLRGDPRFDKIVASLAPKD